MKRKFGLLLITVGALTVIALWFVGGWPRAATPGTRDLSIHRERSVRDHFEVPNDFNSPAIRTLKKQALLGETSRTGKSPAVRLLGIYRNCIAKYQFQENDESMPSLDYCRRESRRWLEVAAQNGDSNAAFNLFNELIVTGRCEDVYRARFWLGKSLSNPNPASRFGLEDFRLKEKTCRW